MTGNMLSDVTPMLPLFAIVSMSLIISFYLFRTFPTSNSVAVSPSPLTNTLPNRGTLPIWQILSKTVRMSPRFRGKDSAFWTQMLGMMHKKSLFCEKHLVA